MADKQRVRHIIKGTKEQRSQRVRQVPQQTAGETRLRYAFAQGLLALIQEVEKYYRFTPLSQGWMVDIGGASLAYKAAFSTLRRG